MEYFYSKYTGEELEERLDRIDDIPELLAEMLTGKNYTTPEDALCIVKKYVPTIYENIPIDNNTIYWANTNDGKVLKARIQSDNNGGIDSFCYWEKKTDSKGNEYLYSSIPIAIGGGATLYVDDESLNLPSIYDGLPIDNVTIYWALDDNGNKVLKSIGQSGGGVADSVAWMNITGKPSWLLDDKIQYTEIEGTPDLSGFITKAYVDDNFVTFSLNEEISGIKTFTNGLKIGNSSINQSQEDVIYIDANLVVRGGVTIYADTGDIDIPSLIDSLPIAGYDTVGARGIASFDSSYFSVTNGIVTLIPDNVGLNETELVEYLTNNNYAQKSDIPSLSGYATQSWVESKGYALNSDLTALSTKVNDFFEGSDTDTIINKWLELEAFLSGLSESDNLATILGTKADKTYVDGNFVTLTTQQTISGEKNFTGGLKVNGSPIVYDADNKYWKLEGDLLVTGGVTMYANEGTYTPSTIMDAIAVDGTTISKDGGVLKVIGDLSGGVTDFWDLDNIPSWIGVNKPSYTIGELSNVGSWADSVASQDRIMYQAANSSQWVAKNLSDLAVGGVTGDYLPLSGGTINNNSTTNAVPLILNSNYLTETALQISNNSVAKSVFGWYNGDSKYGTYMYSVSSRKYLGIKDDGTPHYHGNTIWHAGNDGSGSGLDADLLDGIESSKFYKEQGRFWSSYATSVLGNGSFYAQGYSPVSGAYTYGSILNFKVEDKITQFYITDGAQAKGTGGRLFFRDQYNASDSITSRWIEVITSENIENQAVTSATKLQTARTIWGQSFDGTGNIDGNLVINASTTYPIRIIQSYSSAWASAFLATNSSLTAGQHYNIDFGHSVSAYNAAWVGYYHAGVGSTSNRLSMGLNSVDDVINILGTGNVGVGTTNPYSKLHSVGDITISVQSNNPTASINIMNTPSDFWQISGRYTGSEKGTFKTYYYNGSTWSTIMTLYNNGNMLVTGGITMYSDARKKTILNHVELSLKEIAEAPLIEHYYNSDEKKTTHVGSIAQYWAGLNDWFCKLDNEGYYTMEIQNAALASAISVARELVKFETETDRRIRLLEEENEQLKKEIEILKWNIA